MAYLNAWAAHCLTAMAKEEARIQALLYAGIGIDTFQLTFFAPARIGSCKRAPLAAPQAADLP